MGNKKKSSRNFGRLSKGRRNSVRVARQTSQLNLKNTPKDEILKNIRIVNEDETLISPLDPTKESPISKEEMGILYNLASSKCGNCGFIFPNESCKNRRLENVEEYEIDILDAIWYIYGLTTEDWTRALLLNVGSECKTMPDTFFNDGINFCDKCSEALGTVYKAHVSWKEMSADDSLVAKTINLKSGGLAVLDTNEQEIKSEIDYSENTVEIPTDDFENCVESEEYFYEYDPLEPDISEAEETPDIKFSPCSDSIDILSSSSSNESLAMQKSVQISSKLIKPNSADNTIKEIKTYSKSVSASSSMRRETGETARSIRLETFTKENKNTDINRLKRKYQNIRLEKEGADKNSVVFGTVECCGISFKEESVFNAHCETIRRKRLKDREIPAHKVKCNICGATLHASFLRRHLQDAHGPKKIFSCDICDFKFFVYINLVKHKQLHESPAKNADTLNGEHTLLGNTNPDDFGPVECCGISFRDINVFLKHKHRVMQLNSTVRIKHKTKCLVCQTNLNLNLVLDHMTKVHGQKDKWPRRAPKPVEVYNCNTCGSKFTKLMQYIRHKNTHDKVCQVTRPKYQCNICQKPNFVTLSGLMYHKATHDPSIKFVCDMCGISYKSKRQLKHHKLSKHEKRNYNCDKCPKSFASESLLKKHKESHDSMSVIVCEKCGQRFSKTHRLKEHLQKHEDQESSKEFKCPECGKKLKHRFSLQKHILTQHKSKNLFICEQCGKTTKNATNMKIHMQVHNTTSNVKRPYQLKKPKIIDPIPTETENNAGISKSVENLKQ